MPVSVEPLPYEELTDWVKIQNAAFTGGLGSLLLHGGLAATPEKTAYSLRREQKLYRNPINKYCKAVDSTTGDTVAIAKWQFFTEKQTSEQLESTLKKPQQGDDGFEPLHNEAIDYILDNRRAFMGTAPYIYLSVLCTDPAHHRKGAGGKLVEWGVKQADDLGLPAYLEASIEGRPLYERWGFELVREVHFDLTKLGRPDLSSTDVNCVMIRPARLQAGDKT